MSSNPVRSIRRTAALIAGIVLLASAGTCRADIVGIGDGELPGQFIGTIEVKNQTTTSATIVVSLKNVSPTANGGYLTGFAFNDPNSSSRGNINGVTSFTTSFAPPTGQLFSLIGGPGFNNGIDGSPYGNFDIGAAVGGDWLGGGQPSDGLAVNQTGTFTFVVSGTSLDKLSAANLLGTGSYGGKTAAFVTRFRGFADESSDKDFEGVLCPIPGPTPVPAPPALVLAGMGFGCLLLGRVRFRRAAPQA